MPDGVTSIKLPDGLTSIGYNVFSSCQSITVIIIPDSVTSIDYYAFGNCIKLTKAVIPDTVTTINWGAFENCPALTIYGAETYTKDSQIPFIADDKVIAAPVAPPAGPSGPPAPPPAPEPTSDTNIDDQQAIADPALGELSGGDDVLQIEISHNGALAFVGQLIYQVDPALNGKTVYHYYYNEELKKLVYQDEAMVTDGKVSFSFEHASKYVITDTGTLVPPDIAISYQTHVQNIGWQGFVKNGETSGTFAQSLRLEGIEITANGADNLGVQLPDPCREPRLAGFCQQWHRQGTTRKSLRLEAIQINLTGTARVCLLSL